MTALRFTSRKWLLALASIVLIVANEIIGLGIDPDAYESVVAAVVAYIAGEGTVDAIRAYKGAGTGPDGEGL